MKIPTWLCKMLGLHNPFSWPSEWTREQVAWAEKFELLTLQTCNRCREGWVSIFIK